MKATVRYFNELGGAHTEPGYIRVNPVTYAHEWHHLGGLGTWDPSREWFAEEEVCEHCGGTVIDAAGYEGSLECFVLTNRLGLGRADGRVWGHDGKLLGSY